MKADHSLWLHGHDGSVVMLSDKSKADDMVPFLQLIRKENPARHICILDKARIHHAKSVTEKAEELKIEFIYIPPYLPDLNPIKFGKI